VTIRWTPTGLRDLESLHAWVAENSPRAAAATVEKILEAIAALERHPDLGRKGRVAGTRELIVRPFVVAYRVNEAAIEILSVLHGARRWPDSF
jgi:addiction module RelE/StbE family toxin